MHPAFGLGTSLFEGVNQYFSSLLTDSLARLVSAPKASLTTSIQGMERPVDQWPVNAQGMPEQVRHSRSVVAPEKPSQTPNAMFAGHMMLEHVEG
ncbi:hypothetical protein, partial [Xanthomonas oryzae]|uniref:hypothetical protein n=1 Tax=Xanthomonas oryzae TaxID=347 RepID=UPI001C663F8B